MCAISIAPRKRYNVRRDSQYGKEKTARVQAGRRAALCPEVPVQVLSKEGNMVQRITDSARSQGPQDHQASVAKSALLAAGGFVTAIATILLVAGTFLVNDGTTRYALTVVGVIGAIAQIGAAVYVIRR
jgi:hypothetical protein